MTSSPGFDLKAIFSLFRRKGCPMGIYWRGDERRGKVMSGDKTEMVNEKPGRCTPQGVHNNKE